ncbi:hypothetical protein H9623_13165 [Oerskovia sp. Sa1BUA8]|uniref:Uncharacterized protein n=1 Tax=Oerskovia douganii TaxID=2762210 RepID=A0A9D5Z073_9CELL|nr:hypothetical protein [Oerskovia douganii]MBE7701246.1 hypothetical protein [Oerskovia douganii]
MSGRKRYSNDDMHKAIGRGYQSGLADGRVGAVFSHGYWLNDTSRAEVALDEDDDPTTSVLERIKAEYARHVPVFDPEQTRLGYSISEKNHHLFSCAATDCPHFWPCPTWHLMRHLDGSDQSTYTFPAVRDAEPEKGLHL